MNILTHLDLLSLGLVIASTTVLGFVVYFNNPKSISHRSFLAFCILTVLWGSFNFLTYTIHDPILSLWTLRLSVSFAVWHAFSLFCLLYYFPAETVTFNKTFKFALFPAVSLASILNLTPLVFESVGKLDQSGRLVEVNNGPAIAYFSILVLCLILFGIGAFLRKTIKTEKSKRQPYSLMLSGIVLTFIGILTLNFLFPAFLGDSRFITFGAVFLFPFILFTSYALIRHGLFNVKLLATEILVALLAFVVLIQVGTAEDGIVLVINLVTFLLVVSAGVLLIKSVRKEVEQRQLLERLSAELKQANVALQALDKARAEFISIASHQLRTPPATIKWYLAALLSGDYGAVPSNVAEIIEKAQVTNNSQISLIDDLLNASRIERGKMEFFFEQVNVDEVTKLAVDQLIPQAKMKNLSLSFQGQANLSINMDREKIRQVVNNIIDNAIKYTDKGGIKVSTSTDETNATICVEDTGKGLAPDQLGLVFGKYMRGQTSAMSATGLGLGMYVAKIIVEQHKGKIWVESEGLGKGSKFFVSLPLKSDLGQGVELDLTKEQN